MEHMPSLAEVIVAAHRFTDLDYADDTVLPALRQDDLQLCIADFASSVKTMGMNVSWRKTKVQRFGPGPPAVGVLVDGCQVDHVEQFPDSTFPPY